PLGRSELEVVERGAELKELKDLTEQYERASASLGQWSAFAYAKEQELVSSELAEAQYRVVELQAAVRKQAGDPFAKPQSAPDPARDDDDAADAVVAAEGRVRAAERELVAASVAALRPNAGAVDEPDQGSVAAMPSVLVDTEFTPGVYGRARRGGRWRALRQ